MYTDSLLTRYSWQTGPTVENKLEYLRIPLTFYVEFLING